MDDIITNMMDVFASVCETIAYAWMCFVNYLNTCVVVGKLYNFLKPFFISVVAFSIPFLYNACLNLNKRYNSTLVSSHLRKSRSYILFWGALVISFFVICANMIFRTSIVRYEYGYFVLAFAHCVAILLMLLTIVALFKVIIGTADINYVSQLLSNDISQTKDFNTTYNNRLKRVVEKYRCIKQICEFVFALKHQVLNGTIKGCSTIQKNLSKITIKLRKENILL